MLALLMIFGLATLITGIACWAVLLAVLPHVNEVGSGLFAISAGLSLVSTLVGPGAYSLDAHFFGWRRVEIVRRTRKVKPDIL